MVSLGVGPAALVIFVGEPEAVAGDEDHFHDLPRIPVIFLECSNAVLEVLGGLILLLLVQMLPLVPDHPGRVDIDGQGYLVHPVDVVEADVVLVVVAPLEDQRV